MNTQHPIKFLARITTNTTPILAGLQRVEIGVEIAVNVTVPVHVPQHEPAVRVVDGQVQRT